MPTLLRIDSSASGERSRSRAVTSAFTDAWTALGPDHAVVARDLHADPPPHLPSSALHWPAGEMPGERPAAWEAGQRTYIAELLAADVVLVAVPLYNYSMPSTLKAWVDHVHVPGVTAGFPPEELPLRGRPVVLVSSRGAAYGGSGSPLDWDHGTAALEVVLGASMGMVTQRIVAQLTLADDVEALADRRAEGRASLDAALERARALAADLG
ncbi:FMN-dependent NADH-azoreductase [Pseudolysinimonas sp.]|uniref:FMN-dependent NADH-azoreductase n=1 Tax=Pseudolysinimonas sp. TaxID=2680009 RepID=UPI003F811391